MDASRLNGCPIWQRRCQANPSKAAGPQVGSLIEVKPLSTPSASAELVHSRNVGSPQAQKRQMKETIMPETSPRQRKTTDRVMHEFKHGELKSGRGARGGKVKSRRKAIAIALKEATGQNMIARAKTKESPSARKHATRHISKSRIGARGRRESSRATGGKNAISGGQRP